MFYKPWQQLVAHGVNMRFLLQLLEAFRWRTGEGDDNEVRELRPLRYLIAPGIARYPRRAGHQHRVLIVDLSKQAHDFERHQHGACFTNPHAGPQPAALDIANEPYHRRLRRP